MRWYLTKKKVQDRPFGSALHFLHKEIRRNVFRTVSAPIQLQLKKPIGNFLSPLFAEAV